MQRHIAVGLGALLGLICSGAEAAPRDGRYAVGPGAGAARVTGVVRDYRAPGVPTVASPAAVANRPLARAYPDGAAAAGGYGRDAAHAYRAPAPEWGHARQGYGYLA